MTAEFVEEAEPALRVAKRYEVFAKDRDADWRAVGLRKVRQEECRSPVPAEHLADRGIRTDLGEQLVLFTGEWHGDLRSVAANARATALVSLGNKSAARSRGGSIRGAEWLT